MTNDGRPAKLNRREVLKRAGLATAGTAAGCVAINAAAPVLLPQSPLIDENQSYWSRVLPTARAPLGADVDTDVAIVGGGLTGLSAAYYLRKANPRRRVTLLEAHRCGNGASARNGAMVLTSTGERWLTPTDDAVLDRRLYSLTEQNVGILRELAAEHGVEIELETCGAAQVLRSDVEFVRATAAVAKLRDRGIPVELWDAARVRERLGTAAYRGAVYDPAGGQVHPGRLVAMFRAAAEASGVEIHEDTRVASVQSGRMHTLVTQNGVRVRAPHLVLACNAYSSKLGFLDSAYASVASYIGITPPLDESVLARIGWRSRIPFSDTRIETFYLGVTPDRRLHIGGGPARYGFNNSTPPSVIDAFYRDALTSELARIFPSLGAVEFEKCWCGAVDMSLDEAPAVGRLGRDRNLYYAIGYSGHGVNLTSVFGRIIADLIDGHDDRWSWLPYLDRLPPYLPNEPFRWLGIHASQAAIRASRG